MEIFQTACSPCRLLSFPSIPGKPAARPPAHCSRSLSAFGTCRRGGWRGVTRAAWSEAWAVWKGWTPVRQSARGTQRPSDATPATRQPHLLGQKCYQSMLFSPALSGSQISLVVFKLKEKKYQKCFLKNHSYEAATSL